MKMGMFHEAFIAMRFILIKFMKWETFHHMTSDGLWKLMTIFMRKANFFVHSTVPLFSILSIVWMKICGMYIMLQWET